MSWPIPVFLAIEYPKPISLRVWLPTLVAIASCAVTAVLLAWPNGKPTHTLQFWGALAGAPLGACVLIFGVKWFFWRDEQLDAEVAEEEQHRLGELWRGWSRRQLAVVDVAAFPAATDEIARFAGETIDLPTNSERTITFEWAHGRATAFRRRRLLHLIALRFAATLQGKRQVVVTLLLDEASLKQAEAWTKQVSRIFGSMVSGLEIEVQSANDGVQWINRLVDRVDPATRLVIAAQLWADEEQEHHFSEGGAAFLIEPDATKAGSIFRPMTSAPDTMQIGLGQIKDVQTTPDQLKHVWVAGCAHDESTAIRSSLAPDPNDMPGERLLDGVLGTPGPASGWLALAIAMESMRGAGPQLVAWREPKSESLYLCAISPVPQKETTV